MISNQILANFCNKELRVCNDASMGVLMGLQQMVSDYQAKGIEEILATGAADAVIDDGSVSGSALFPNSPDGRVPITRQDVESILTAVAAVKTLLDTPDSTGVSPSVRMQKISVNIKSPLG